MLHMKVSHTNLVLMATLYERRESASAGGIDSRQLFYP